MPLQVGSIISYILVIVEWWVIHRLRCLEELFLNQGDYVTTRFRFWKMVTDLFSSAYMKQIYDWCEQHNLKLTVHLLREENMMIQLPVNGACMPHYEYFHIPGMDWLGRDKAKRNAV